MSLRYSDSAKSCRPVITERSKRTVEATRMDELTAADVNLGLAGQKAAVSSLLLTTVQGGFRGGICRR